MKNYYTIYCTIEDKSILNKKQLLELIVNYI